MQVALKYLKIFWQGRFTCSGLIPFSQLSEKRRWPAKLCGKWLCSWYWRSSSLLVKDSQPPDEEQWCDKAICNLGPEAKQPLPQGMSSTCCPIRPSRIQLIVTIPQPLNTPGKEWRLVKVILLEFDIQPCLMLTLPQSRTGNVELTHLLSHVYCFFTKNSASTGLLGYLTFFD